MHCAQVETHCGGNNAWICEYLYWWCFSTEFLLGCEQKRRQNCWKHELQILCQKAQTPIFSHGCLLPCQDRHKNQHLMAIDTIINGWEVHSLNKSKVQLISSNMPSTFAGSQFGTMIWINTRDLLKKNWTAQVAYIKLSSVVSWV